MLSRAPSAHRSPLSRFWRGVPSGGVRILRRVHHDPPPPPPPPPPENPPELNPDPPDPPGVEAIAVDIEDEKLLTSRENDDAMNAPDPTYQPLVCVEGWPSSPSNALAHLST